MTYIRGWDVEFPDPDLATPYTCDRCGCQCTWEDCDRVTDLSGTRALICPDCFTVQWPNPGEGED